MPRDSNGNYILPAGNPVVSGELISTSWANPTMQDVAVELTNSLDRQGRGGMLAPFKFADGTVGAPSLTFTNEPTTGLYRFGAQDLRVSIAGLDKFRWTATGAQVWDPAALPNPAWVSVANQNQIDAISTTLTNVAKLDAENIFTNGQRIQHANANLSLWKDATPTKAGRVAFNTGVPDGLDLAVWNGAAWNAKFLADATASLHLNNTHTLKSADGSATLINVTTNASEFGVPVFVSYATPRSFLYNTAMGVDQRIWGMRASGGRFDISAWDDVLNFPRTVIAATRSGYQISNIEYGNPTNNPSHSFFGPQTINGDSSVNGLLSASLGGESFRVRAATADHVYMAFYARTASLSTRSGFIGFGSAGGAHMQVYNEISGGDIQLAGAGSGNVMARDGVTGASFPVGFKNVPTSLSFTGNVTQTVAHNGTAPRFLGGAGVTWTTCPITYDGETVTILNNGTAALTISCPGVMRWFSGSATTDGATRTLAVGGVATLLAFGAAGANTWAIFGSGIS